MADTLEIDEETKVTQDVANYRVGTESQSCAGCRNFLAPDACSVVEGTIAPGGLSDLFEPARTAEPLGLPEELF